MKKFFGLLLIAGALCVALAQGSFCDGWAAGYKAGYCYQKFGCIEPIVPICPIPAIGESTFQDGYNRGLLAGVAAQ